MGALRALGVHARVGIVFFVNSEHEDAGFARILVLLRKKLGTRIFL